MVGAREKTMTRIFIIFLAVVFAVFATLTVLWLVVTGWDYGMVVGVVGERGARLINTLLLGVLALTSGVLLLYHKRTNPYAEPAEQWTMAEIIYALVLFAALFLGVYSAAGLYFSP